MFSSVPDVTALALLAVGFFLLKAVVDACLGLLAARTPAPPAVESRLGEDRRLRSQSVHQ
jgi:hypothetical protein